MLVTVCRLYKNGVPNQSIKEAIAGNLSLGRHYHPVLCRELTTLNLISDARGAQPIQPLFDAFCYEIAATGMWFRGFEVNAKGQQIAQEWCIQPTPVQGPNFP